VKEVVPKKMIGYSWNFKEYVGEGYSSFELASLDGKTLLNLKNHVIQKFPSDIPEFKRESGQAGWEYLIKNSLVKFLSSKD
jgi:hypothetical protein